MKKQKLNLKNAVQLLLLNLCSAFVVIYDGTRLKYAQLKAEVLHRLYNQRYYVLMDYSGGLNVFNNKQLRALKTSKLLYLMRHLNNKSTRNDLLRQAVYYTAIRNNNTRFKMTLQQRSKRACRFIVCMQIKRTYFLRRRIEVRKLKQAKLIK